MSAFDSLERFSPRALNLIGTVISGQETRVVLSNRLVAAAVTVLESRTVMLDPKRTHLYDLVLAARLLRYRGDVRRPAGRKDRVRGRRKRQWLDEAHASLRQDYPGILRLPGRFHPGADDRELEIVWKSVAWKPMDPTTLPGRVILSGVPDVEITGTQDDYSWLVNALQAGTIPLEDVRTLEGMPVATIPLTLSFSESYGPKIEALEQHIAEHQGEINGLINCYRRKSETLQELMPLGRHTYSGLRLDSARLVDAVLARRTHLTPKLFKERNANFQPVFDPRQHLVVMGVDLNGLHGGTLEDPAFSQRFLAWLIKVYQTLEVDFAVLGFADHILELPNGGRVYAHVPISLKKIDEDFDGQFWNRLAHVLEHPPQLPGEPACYHPLHMRSLGRLLERVAEERRHSYRTILFGARRGMPAHYTEFHTPEFLTRTANALDEEIVRLREQFEGTLDTLASFVPRALIEHARKGGAVAEMF